MRSYRVIVEGELSDELGAAFDPMPLERIDGTTVLTGRIRDQSELHALLRRIADLGLTLLEVRAISGFGVPAPSGGSRSSM